MRYVGENSIGSAIALPDEAGDTVFEHVMLDWNPNGHDPQVLFGKPHFDMHFYLADTAEVHGIDPADPEFAVKAARLPDPRYVPLNYVPPPGPPEASVVPAMGLHWSNAADGLVPGEFDFTEVLLNGSWDGEFTERVMQVEGENKDWVSNGRAAFHIIERNGKYVLRLADNESEVRKQFGGHDEKAP